MEIRDEEVLVLCTAVQQAATSCGDNNDDNKDHIYIQANLFSKRNLLLKTKDL